METERIVLDVDDRPAVAAAARANAGIKTVEQTANRSVDAAMSALNADAERIVRVTERSKRSISQITSSVERRALAAGNSPLEQLAAQRSRDLTRVAGDPAAVGRVTAAYERLIGVQNRADFVAAAGRAQRASVAAATGTRQFEAALARTNKELERQRALAAAAAATQAAGIEREVIAIERRAAALGRSGVQQLAASRDTHIAGLADPAQIGRVTAAYGQLIGAQKLSEEVQRRSEATARLQAQAAAASSFGRVMSVAVTGSLLLAAGAGLKMSERFEGAKRAFTQFEGSSEKAVLSLQRLESFALQTPFEFNELIPAAQRMRALQFASNEVVPVLRAVGDQVAALGGGKDYIDRIVLALGQMQVKTKVSGEEVRQLAEAGIPAWEAIAKRIGISVPEAMKRAEQGTISAAVAIPAILESMVQRTSGLMAKQNQSLTGQFSNLKDQTGFLLRDLGALLTPVALQVVQFGQTVVGGMRTAITAFRDLPQAVQLSALALIGIVALAGPVASAAGLMARALLALNAVSFAGGIGAIGTALSGLIGVVGNVAIAIRTGMTGALIGAEASLLLFGKAALFVGAAFAGWKVGSWISDLLDLGDASLQAAYKSKAAAEEQLKFASNKAFESLRRRGVVIKQEGQSLEAWGAQLRGALQQLNVFDEMSKRGNKTHDDGAKILQAEKRAHDELLDAQRDAVTGVGRLLLNYQKLRAELGLTTKANRELAEATVIRIRQEAQADLRRNAANVVTQLQQESDLRRQSDSQHYERARQIDADLAELGIRNTVTQLEQEQALFETSRDSQLRALEAVNARTLDQKLALESRKAEIEEQYQLKVFQFRAELLDLQQDHELRVAEAGAIARGESEEQVALRRSQIIREFGLRGQDLERRTQASIDATRESAGNRSAQLVHDNTERIFNQIKGTSDRVFGDMLRSGESMFRSLGNVLKNALLTSIREVVSSQVARALTQLLTGQRVGFSGSAGSTGGGLGSFGNLLGGLGLGAAPVFGGSGGAGFAGLLGPGGTSGFAGPLGGAAGAAPQGGGVLGGGGGGGFAGFGANAAAQKAGLLDFLGLGGSISTGAGAATTLSSATLLQKLSAVGKSNAALAGGGLLAYDGLRRGGALGLAETTAGGALIGFKFGGPIGALIGGGIGAAAGTARLFIKGAQEKIVEKIKAVYGITISKDFARDPLLGIIKSQFGGNIDLGIRSPQVRDLIELYGMSFGQSGSNFAPIQRPLALAQRGGTLFELPAYQNGSSLAGFGGGVTPAAYTPAPAPVSTTITLSPEDARQLLATGTLQTIADNPRAVQASSAEASRRSIPSKFLTPGLVTS